MSFFKEIFGSGQGEVSATSVSTPHESSATNGAETPPDPSVVFDPVKVLEAAGLRADRRQYVSRTQELIQLLPADAPTATKRQIVEAAFRAFEVPLAQILDAAEAEISTYQLFIRASEEHLSGRRARGEARIGELEAEIARLRENLRLHEEQQQSLAASARSEIGRIQPVLDFFDSGVEEISMSDAGSTP